MTRAKRQAQRYALPGEGPTDEDLEHEVELTRRELSDTVAELVQRMNVKLGWNRPRNTGSSECGFGRGSAGHH
jgi:hypothetical protein